MTGFNSKQQMAADKVQEPAQDSANYLRAVLNAYGPDAGISLDQKSWSKLHAAIKAALAQPAQEPVAVHQFRSPHCADWYDGHPDPEDGHGPYETRTLYTAPPKRERVVFPTMLRKMWSGGEVQAWLDENVNKEKNA